MPRGEDVLPTGLRRYALPGSDAIPPAVRPAARAEIAAISALVAAAFAEFRTLAPAAAWEAYVARTCDVAARWDHGEVLVAVHDDRIVGTVTYYPEAGGGLPPGSAGFGSLAVHPAARGRGVGAAFVSACLARAQADGVTMLAIHTSEPMRAARAVYERLGFRRCPELDRLASSLVAFDPSEGDVPLLGFRHDLIGRRAHYRGR